MKPKRRLVHAQRMTVVNGVLLFVVLLVLLQLWLLTATVNAYLDGDMTIALPAALVSASCLALGVGLLRYVYRFDE